MKRADLEAIEINGAKLPKETVDQIMAWNGADIENAKKPFSDYENLKTQLQTAKDGLKAFEGVDIAQLQGRITQLQNDLTAKDTEWQGKLADMEFNKSVSDAITAAHGRNAKAIMALLDMEALKQSKNRADDTKSALAACQKENPYLFGGEREANPYADGAGASGTGNGEFDGVEAAFRSLNPGIKFD